MPPSALAMLARVQPAAERSTSVTIRVGLLGAAHGHVTYALTEAREADDVEIVAAGEGDPALRETFLAGLPCPVGGDELRILDDFELDAAVVCGVYARRAGVIAECLRRGVPVLADKPICTTLEQWERIRAAATEGRAGLLATMFDKRFYPETRAAGRLLADGVLGELAMFTSSAPHKLLRDNRHDWFFRQETYGGIAGDLPTHDIDILLTLTGARNGTVTALTGKARHPDLPEFDDHVAVLLDADGVPAAIDANWLHPDASGTHGHYSMRLVGSEGTAEVGWTNHSVTVTTHDRGTWQEPLAEKPRPVQFFFDALREGRPPEVTTADSLRASRVALLAARSAEQGGRPERFDLSDI